MNDVLQLRGTLQQRPSSGRPGSPNVPKKNGETVSSTHLKKLAKELKDLDLYWQDEKLITGALIDVNYIDVIAKSNRIGGYFNKGKRPNESVVGARFNSTDPKRPKHIITHYISSDVIKDTIKKVENSIKILDAKFGGDIGHDDINSIDSKNIDFEDYKLSKSVFLDIIVDSYYIQSFDYPKNSASATNRQIVTVYKTDEDTSAILNNIGITITPGKMLSDNDTTILLQPDEIKLLQNKAPYLIAMALDDLTKLSLEDIVIDGGTNENKAIDKLDTITTIDTPKSEPVIGVIDTLFDNSVYFSEWVDYRDMVPSEITKIQKDYRHGTAVSSIIVDGHRLNPTLDDGCGHFRVRHFGVAVGGQYSSFTIIKLIQEIVANNRDVKVWNLSLGSAQEVNGNSISPEAAALDKIQCDNDVIFVIAGTNKPDNRREEMLIGAPADSINSVVVNSVDKNNEPASYSRKGRVLSFFNKPDVSAFGGNGKDYKDNICVCASRATYEFVSGTSFAAPWIARKLAYLIEIMGLSREVAKALIVDAAAGWNDTGNNQDLAPFVGHGAVPIKLDDIVKSKDDEIKFIMSGTSEQYDTYAYNLPVPVNKGAHPFIAKATLCYFPKCSINQDVDYTNTELDLSIGRIDNKDSIKPINRNMQGVSGHYIYEGEARKLFRKWDNTKHIREKYGDRLMARKAYKDKGGRWGISVKTKERLEKRDGYGIKFGLVVTLKEISGINRINDFKQKALAAGWRVEEISVQTKVDIYNQLQQPLNFDS
jgi:hypothetical protein